MCDKERESKIGLAKSPGGGLYYLPVHENKGQDMEKIENVYVSTVSRGSKAEEKAWLLHCRLGHPSFQTLRLMLPEILKGTEDNNLCMKFLKEQNTTSTHIVPNRLNRRTPHFT